VFNILLQVLEDGRLTDSKGRTVDFRNTVIIMTSNVGAETIRSSKKLGFTVGTQQEYENMRDRVMAELRKTFRPEFLNRIDEVIVFHALEETHIRQIASLMAKELQKRLKEQDMDFELTDAALDYLVKEGFDPIYGARPLRRAIQKNIEDKLSEEILKGTIQKGDKVIIDVQDGKLVVQKTAASQTAS